ncbi:MAG: methyltransferase domain-containing protein [Myxococcaceae bacterium]
MRVQVEPSHYTFGSYDSLQRWCSYWHQLDATLKLRPRRVLEIGPGSGVFSGYLRNLGIEVRSVDIDETRRPDYLGSVVELDTALPREERFDVVCAFQILEHLPHAQFDACLGGISRRAPHALISLPHHGVSARLSVAFAGLQLRLGGKLPKPWPFVPDGQHHWELGLRHPISRITSEMERHFEVLDRFHVPENPYHFLWVLRSRRRTCSN